MEIDQAIDAVEGLFVYGSLAPGRPNAHVLGDLEGSWQPARVRGHLYPEGWGAALGYPALVLNSGGEWVAGQLFTSAQLPAYWAELDAFEGDAYSRVTTVVTLSGGGERHACTYVLRHPPDSGQAGQG